MDPFKFHLQMRYINMFSRVVYSQVRLQKLNVTNVHTIFVNMQKIRPVL